MMHGVIWSSFWYFIASAAHLVSSPSTWCASASLSVVVSSKCMTLLFASLDPDVQGTAWSYTHSLRRFMLSGKLTFDDEMDWITSIGSYEQYLHHVYTRTSWTNYHVALNPACFSR